MALSNTFEKNRYYFPPCCELTWEASTAFSKIEPITSYFKNIFLAVTGICLKLYFYSKHKHEDHLALSGVLKHFECTETYIKSLINTRSGPYKVIIQSYDLQITQFFLVLNSESEYP